MPYSSNVFDKDIEKVIKSIKPKEVFDVGSGAGKYGQMIKNIDSNIRITGIEVEKDYIEKFKLDSIYDEIWNMSVNEILNTEYYDKKFECLIIGDVLEHLKKSDGIDLLNFLIYRSRWIILQFPEKYLQNSVNGYFSEAHISVWKESDFQIFEKTKLYKKDTQRLLILKGYLENKISIKDIEENINE